MSRVSVGGLSLSLIAECDGCDWFRDAAGRKEVAAARSAARSHVKAGHVVRIETTHSRTYRLKETP